MNAEIKFDLRNEDLKDPQELGQGNGGRVKRWSTRPLGRLWPKR